MTNKSLTLILLLFLINGYSQPTLNFGYNIGRYDYLEHPQHNFATQFNLGWDFTNSGDKALIDFDVSADKYTLQQAIEWGKITKGFHIGLNFGEMDDEMFMELNFNGISHIGSGERTNVTTGQIEKLKQKSKNGGVSWNFGFRINDFISVYSGVTVSRYFLSYSWEGKVENSVKNQRIGYRGSSLTKIKSGGRFFNIGVPLGCKINLFQMKNFGFALRPEHIFYMNNSFSKIDRTVYNSELIFNVNHFNLGFIFSYKINN